MKKDITICIGTVGYPTFDKCKKTIDKLYEKDSRIKKVSVIKNMYPTSSWLNKMRDECLNTTWCLQVDEDMYLHDHAIDSLINLARKKESRGVRILNASGLLFDTFLITKIGSLKLWRSEALQKLKFKDVSGSDRNFAKRASALGYENVSCDKVLGFHDSAPSPMIAYFKYMEYISKIHKFSSEKNARKSLNYLKSIYDKNKDFISFCAYSGGLNYKISNNTKNYKENCKLWGLLEEALITKYNLVQKNDKI